MQFGIGWLVWDALPCVTSVVLGDNRSGKREKLSFYHYLEVACEIATTPGPVVSEERSPVCGMIAQL